MTECAFSPQADQNVDLSRITVNVVGLLPSTMYLFSLVAVNRIGMGRPVNTTAATAGKKGISMLNRQSFRSGLVFTYYSMQEQKCWPQQPIVRLHWTSNGDIATWSTNRVAMFRFAAFPRQSKTHSCSDVSRSRVDWVSFRDM